VSINIYDVVVESCDPRSSHAWLQVDRTRLAARRWDGIRRGQRLQVRIRPEDVLLCEGHPGRVSARNVLPGHVRAVRFVPGGVFIDLEVGFPLTALITRQAAKDLRLRRGSSVYAIVKAVVVTPDVPLRSAFRASLVGLNGMLSHERIDFLKAIERVGSLSVAAVEIGITYRTAWLWAREINRVWGKTLLARTHGGKGGGGTVLTPEGHSVLLRASRIESLRDRS
jgi:molybdate transport repressor ModE-like protein/molybdopterin-binding protein